MSPTLITIDGNNYISACELEKLGCSADEIEGGIREYLNGNSTEWHCYWKKRQDDPFIDILSLPDRLRKNLKIEESAELNSIKPLKPLNGMQIMDILIAQKEGYKDFLVHYQKFQNKKREKYAKKHAVLLKCAEMYLRNNGKRGTAKWLFQALKNLNISYYEHIDSFRRKLRQILHSKKTLPELIIHPLNGKTNESVKKVSKWHKLKAMDLMAQGDMKVEILQKVNNECKPSEEIAYSTLLNLIDRETENITAEDRYGYKFFKQNLEPYIRRQKPEFKFQVVEADGTRFQIPYHENNFVNPKFLKLYVIMDVFSSMILGFSIDDEENKNMVLDAYRMMLSIHQLIPACIIVDKSKPHKSQLFEKFKYQSNKHFGTLWREHLPDYPNSKGTVERFHYSLNVKFIRNHPKYIGLSMHAKSKDHSLRSDKIKEIHKYKKDLPSRKELVLLISKYINKWNANITKEKSPLQIHNNGKIKDAQSVGEEYIAKLCWNSIKRTIRRSRIIISNYEYALESNKNRSKLNRARIDVYYHNSCQEHVFLFDGDVFIEKCYRKRFFSEESGSKFDQIRRNKSYRDYNKKRLKANREELHKLESSDPFFQIFGEPSKEDDNEKYVEFLFENEKAENTTKELPDLNTLPIIDL